MESENSFKDREQIYRDELKKEIKAYGLTQKNYEQMNIEVKGVSTTNTGLHNEPTNNNTGGFRFNELLTNNIITNNLGVLTDNILTNNVITKNLIPTIINKKKLLGLLGLPSKLDELNTYGRWWRFYDSGIVICNLLVLLLSFYDYELNFSYPRRVVSEYNYPRIMMVVISLLAIFCVIKRHQNKLKWKKTDTTISMAEEFDIEDFLMGGVNSFFFQKKKFFKLGLIFDILINLILPYPYLDFKWEIVEIDREFNEYVKVEYLFSDIIYIMIILRMIYVVRASINYSIFMDQFASSISKEYDVKCNIRFALKCILKTEHFKVVLVFLIASILLLGFMLRVFERPFWAYKHKLEFEHFFTNAFWLIFITMMTIGYGDISPLTTPGKVICTIAGLWGIFISSLLVVCLYGLLDLSNDQFLVFTHIVKSREAVKFIEDAFTLRKLKNSKKSSPQAIKQCYDDLMQSYTTFQNMRNESKSIYRSNGLLHYNLKLLNQMKRLHCKFDKIELDIESLAR
jgi:hypothetical protein